MRYDFTRLRAINLIHVLGTGFVYTAAASIEDINNQCQDVLSRQASGEVI